MDYIIFPSDYFDGKQVFKDTTEATDFLTAVKIDPFMTNMIILK